MSAVGGSSCVVEGGAAGKVDRRAAMLRLYRPSEIASGSPLAARAGQSCGAWNRLVNVEALRRKRRAAPGYQAR